MESYEENGDIKESMGFFAKASIHRNDRVGAVPMDKTSHSVTLRSILLWKETWIPAGVASLVVLLWFAFNAAQCLTPIIGVWSAPIIWAIIFSPTEMLVIYAKLCQRREKHDERMQRRSAYDASLGVSI